MKFCAQEGFSHFYLCAGAQMKVFIAQESTNGENFIQPLDGCRDVLER